MILTLKFILPNEQTRYSYRPKKYPGTKKNIKLMLHMFQEILYLEQWIIFGMFPL